MNATGGYIGYQRTRLGMTLIDAAALSNPSKQTYQNIEKGRSTVKVESLLKACKAQGIGLDINTWELNNEWI